MSKYKKLLSNTLLFGIATFSSKLLTLALMPVLTRLLTPADYSTMDLVISTCNFIVPVISLCIHEAVIRFGLDNTEKKSDVFTTAMLTIFAGYFLLLICYPIMGMITRINAYLPLIYVYILTSAMRTTVTHFVRASGFVKIFALDGLFTTASTVAFVFLFVAKLKLGVPGYVISTIIADAISAFGLIFMLKLYKFFKPRSFKKSTMREMVRYSAPLMPTAIFWWITNLSDRYLVDWISGPAANGLYAVAYKIPTMITLVSTIFIQAWQISAFSEKDKREQAKFYTTVFTAYYTLIFLAAACLIIIIKPITKLIVHESFYSSWQYSPFLILAVAFSCLVTFLGTIYNVAKSNKMVTVTTFIGAIINIVLNLLLIPKHGPQGAAFATFISYFTVFVIRVIDTRRFIAIKINALRIIISFLLLLAQTFICINDDKFSILFQIICILLLLIFNFGTVVYIVTNFTKQLKGRRSVAS